jgi:hypothetical protein
MLITYIIALAVTVLLLLSAVRIHFSFGLHRGIMSKVNVAGSHVEERPLHLHEHIFRKNCASARY